jgi:hypothetical protein
MCIAELGIQLESRFFAAVGRIAGGVFGDGFPIPVCIYVLAARTTPSRD